MSPPAKRLRRSRVACEPCRIRKRRCDGQQPCETCTQFAYDCFYDVNTRKKRNKGPITRSPALPTPVAKPRSSPEERTRSEPPAPVCTPASQDTAPMESNSGAAFVRRLGLTLDPANAPEPQIFAWNIGTRPLPGTYPALPPTETISQAEMQRLSQIFFDKVSTVYGFLDRETCNNAIQTRWHRPPTLEPYDTVLCGIAAIGYLFSERKPVAAELHLVETARTALEHNSMSMAGVPSPTLIFGWTLRLMYLRLAGTPHPAWMVSCNLLHMIDAGGFHLDPKGDAPALVRPPPNIDPDIRRRLVAYVQYVNTWISYDLGRSRVQLYGAPYTSPSPTDPGDYTAEMLDLLPLSEILAPHKPADPEQLATLLTKVLDSERTQAPYILSQCNLALCIFRRLRVLCGSKATNSDNDIAPRILTLCTKALASARDLLNSLSPWSHVANVPFQIVYTMLVIDTPDSTTILADAMQTLRLVVELYDTESLHDAYCAAGRLVYLQQRAKEKEVRRLKEIIEGHLPNRSTTKTTNDTTMPSSTESKKE
ncbi:hypothetical protein BDW74DRAFT_184623 [Aspergillus multicolor]|uniref:putative C6 transcription factor n=1 Tax=Aspergillus multicolor TaxID=41759 RepID=UPI003CCDB68F